MMKAVLLLIFALTTTITSLPSFAFEDHFIPCHGCSTNQKSSVVRTWGLNNISDTDAEMGIPKVVHFVDYTRGEIDSFLLYKRPMQRSFHIQSVPISTPVEFADKIREFKVASYALKRASNELIIPESVISEPWEFVGCRYCAGQVEDYYNTTLDGEITRWTQVAIDVSTTFNVTSGMNNVVELKFANGGRIVFKVGIIANTSKLRIKEVVAVFDADKNKVPMTEKEARNSAIRVTSESRRATINSYLHIWALGIPSGATGRVIIRECEKLDHADCDDL